MDATRIRFGAIVEWAVAAICIVVVLVLGAFLIRELRAVRPVMPVSAREAPTPLIAPPAAIPPGAVSVPMILFSNGTGVRVGETLSIVMTRIGRGVGVPAAERAPNGERITHTYEYDGTLFQLVFEPFEQDAEPRLAAIYR